MGKKDRRDCCIAEAEILQYLEQKTKFEVGLVLGTTIVDDESTMILSLVPTPSEKGIGNTYTFFLFKQTFTLFHVRFHYIMYRRQSL